MRHSSLPWTALAALLLTCAPSVVQGQRAPAWRLETTRLEPTWTLLSWAGQPGEFTVSHRLRRPRAVWEDHPPTTAFSYSVVGLKPEATYEFRVRRTTPGPAPGPSASLTVTMPPAQPRQVGTLRLWPVVRLATFPSAQSTPCLAAWNGLLCVVEAHGGAVYVSKVSPRDFGVVSTLELVPRSAEASGNVRVKDACAIGDKLCVLYDRIAPSGSTRAALAFHDLAHDQPLPGEVVITSPEAKASTVGGGLQARRQELWVLWSEVEQSAARLCLAPCAEGQLGEVQRWLEAPTTVVGDLSLGQLAGELVVTFTDAAAGRAAYEPLWQVRLSGTGFVGLRKLADLGRSRGPASVEMGPSLYLLYSTDLPYAGYGGRYRDLRLATLLAGEPGLETITYLDDMKYNCHGDAAALDGVVYLVHEKLECEPSESTPTPLSYGTFIGRVELGEVSGTTSR